MTAPGFHLQSATSDFNKRADSTFAQLSNQGLSHASASVKPPSHLADATKYTHYSITDDDTGPDNDATNRRVAMDFLREMKERKANNEANPPDTENDMDIANDGCVEEEPGRIEFRKPLPVVPPKMKEIKQPVHTKPSRTTDNDGAKTQNKIKLSHLYNDDEEE